jgi:hypothetical protein
VTAGPLRALAGWCGRRPVHAVLLVYAVSRLVVVAALLVATRAQTPTGVGHLDPGLGDMFGLWDGQWYGRIAREGYPQQLPHDPATGRITYYEWAFYPLLPALMAPFVAAGASPSLVGALLGLVLGAVAAVLAHRLLASAGRPAVADATADADGPSADRRRWALVAVGFWCLLPATPVLLQPYTEALAAVLLFGCLLALQRSRYVLAGLLALVLGLTRAVAPALAVVVAVVLVLQWRADRRAGRRPLHARRGASAFLVVAVGVSAVLWPVVVGVATGVPDAFLQTQAAWGQRPGEGPFVAWVAWAWRGHGRLGVAVLVGVVAAYVGLVLGRQGARLGPVLRAVGVAYPLYLLAVVRPITSMWRFALLDLPLSGLLAALVLRGEPATRVRRWVPVVVVLVLLAAGVVAWTSTVWTYEPYGSSPP